MDPAYRIIAEMKSGKLFPVYMLLGEDREGKDEFITELKNGLFKDEEDAHVATSVYFGDEADASDILETLKTFSFFSSKKLVVVHNFDRLKRLDPLLKYLETPDERSILILLSEKNSTTKKVQERVVKMGRACIFWPMFVDEGERWVVNRLHSFGIEAEPEAVKYIIDISGTSKQDLAKQIDSIGSLLNRGELLTLRKAKENVSKLVGYTVFDLCNALFMKTACDILGIFRHLIGNGEDMVKILYFCTREIRKLLEAYSLREAGYKFSAISQKLRFRKSEAQRIGRIVNELSANLLRRLYSDIVSLDYFIKTSSKELSLVAFERFLIGLGKRRVPGSHF